MKAAVRGLAGGVEGYEKYKRIFQEKFVFLNVYCTSVASEEEPRGPEGPYRFQDRSVPVLVIKRWDGETLVQQLGFSPDEAQATRALAQIVDKALKEHGPVVLPRALRPLIARMEKANQMLEKDIPAAAIRELRKVVQAAADERKFPDGPPDLATKAAAMLDELRAKAEALRAEAEALAETDPEAAAKALREIDRKYGRL